MLDSISTIFIVSIKLKFFSFDRSPVTSTYLDPTANFAPLGNVSVNFPGDENTTEEKAPLIPSLNS